MLAQFIASEERIVVPAEKGLWISVKGLIYSLAEDMWYREVW
jgi:hypothetical protein